MPLSASQNPATLPGKSPASGIAPSRSRAALLLPFSLTVAFLALGIAYGAPAKPRLAWTFYGIAAFLLCWQIALLILSKRTAREFAWEFVAMPSHYVQALVQLSVYVYWGWYWRNVYAEAPLILSQVAFLYVVDALLTWSRGQKWRFGFGPWPIVFSTNLFMWFRDDWFVFQFLMVATGVFGKQFVRWKRNGQLTHIFNPSAFALTIFSLGLIFTGNTAHTWGEEIAITQGLPPYLYLTIFLGGLVVQYFFSVTLLTFSAAAMTGLFSLLYTKITGVYLFVDSNIPIAVFLGLHLLMTDPATTPRSNIGKIIFGSLYGIGVCGAFIILDFFNVPTFYDKLVVVPVLNLLTPLLDRLAAWNVFGKTSNPIPVISARRLNLTFMGCWAVLFVTMLKTDFVEAPHPGATIGFWKKATEENRLHAAKYLRLLLNDFDRQNLDDPSAPVGTIGATGTETREQALGNLCLQVGLIYAEGKSVPADPTKAIRYFTKACDCGNPYGCANLASQFLVSKRTVPDAEIQRALSTLEQASATANDGSFFFLLAYAYDIGDGRAQDKARARQLYEKGALLGDLNACKNLARMQLTGEGGPPDHAAAANWFQKAADQHDGMSCLQLAKLYHNGDGVPRDEQKSNALLQQACDLGIQPACEILKQQTPALK